MAVIRGVARFMSEARALTNFIGNGVATLAVANWTGDLDSARMKRILAHPTLRIWTNPKCSSTTRRSTKRAGFEPSAGTKT